LAGFALGIAEEILFCFSWNVVEAATKKILTESPPERPKTLSKQRLGVIIQILNEKKMGSLTSYGMITVRLIDDYHTEFNYQMMLSSASP